MVVRQLQEIFLESLKGPLADLLEMRDEALMSLYLDQNPIQDAFRYRAKYIGLKFAGLLVDEKGELNKDLLDELNQLLAEGPFVLGPAREGDVLIFGHIRNCLRWLTESKEVQVAFRKFSPPLCHKKAEEVIRETLWPEPIKAVQTVHIRKAVIASWLTFLRQTTGSCFATAPAILIQQTDPLRFFKDIYDLLSTGQMKRTVDGKEYSVPLSLNTGKGDLLKIGTSSPGLAMALESAGIAISNEILNRIKELGPLNVEKLLSALLMEHIGLTQEDIEDEEHLSRIQMTLLLAKQTAVYYQRPSERALKVSDWKKKVLKACTTFRTVTECALLRSWEYSIASFSDVKTEFARWNLYIGLGLHPDQKGGIGEFLYAQVNRHLQKCNAEIERLAEEYNQALNAVDALETMFRAAPSEARRNQIKSEMMTHNLNLSTILELRNELLAKSDALVGFFSSLIEQYDQKMQESFQELFDPALIGEEAHLYDDSSAGFRLVYKHGRLDASQWTVIYDGEHYIDCLRDFFTVRENELHFPPVLGRELVSEITTALIQFIRTPEFLASALARSKEKGRRSPWDYISGGTLQTLLMAYCNRNRPFTELSVVPRSEEDLFRFLASIKGGAPLLMHSPTHAFIIFPGLFTSQPTYKKCVKWNEEMQEHIAHQVSNRLAEEERALFIHLVRQKPTAATNILFRTYLIEALSSRTKHSESIIDSVLYENSPLFCKTEAKEAVNQILRTMGRGEPVGQFDRSFYGAFDLSQITKAILLKAIGKAILPLDWDQKIVDTMRRLGILPNSVLFADTNWSGWYFGFVKNPTTERLELWRLNRTATQGFPMTDWKQWFDPSNTSAWVVLNQPKEYMP
jgi:hypothetical protein